MKKLISVILVVSLVACACIALADVNWGSKTLNQGEIAGQTLAMFLGDPLVMNVNKKSNTDEINSRYIYIGSQDMGCDIAVVLRVSDTQVYLWKLDLTPENLIKAKLALDEDAPACCVAYFEGKEMKDSAVYSKEYRSFLSFDDFKKDVERITSSLGTGDLSATTGSSDPFLATFPGLSWGMTKDEIMNIVGGDHIMKYDLDDGSSLTASIEILGKRVLVLFIFSEKDKLDMIDIVIDKEDSDTCLETLTQVYGKPHKTTLIGAIKGRMMDIEDDPSGNMYAWKTDKSLIMFDDAIVQYWSLY